MSTAKFYAGIGSRLTPPDIQLLMTRLARRLDLLGYVLRSGGANGADTAFELGSLHSEIYLPWENFNNRSSQLFYVSDEALAIAAKHHPVWDRLPRSVKQLMGRNVYQVLGYDLQTPSQFVICWTEDGCEKSKDRTAKTGGTGLAISVACEAKIPVINLKHRPAVKKLAGLINGE